MGATVDQSVADPVTIAACGAVTPFGLGIDSLADAIAKNASGLRPCERFAGCAYQTNIAGCVPEEVIQLLRTANPDYADSKAFLLANTAITQVRDSLKNVVAAVPPARRGFVLSTTKANIESLERTLRDQQCSVHAERHQSPALLAQDLASFHQFSGPVQCVSAACISGLLAIQQGALMLKREQADLVFVAGVDLVSQFVLSGFSTLKSLDPQGCRPFDQGRVGLSLGEGAGALVLALQSPETACLATVRGWGTSNDANHLTGPSRDGSGLALAICRALRNAGVEPQSIDYINAHGTGTPYNDAMESLAFASVFDPVPPFSSTKGMLGHTLGAAGILETILCTLALQLQVMPGTARLNIPDPVAPKSLLYKPERAELRRILKVNCGFAGTNAAIVLEGKPR